MIVIFGATGSTGRPLVQRLVELGAPVRVAARNADQAKRLFPTSVDVVGADLSKPSTLPAALANATRVYCAVGGATGAPNLVELESGLIDAAAKAGVGHYVKISGIDAPDRVATIQQWHADIERHLESSKVPFTVLRPTFFFQNFLAFGRAVAQGVLPIPTGAGACSLIDARDIAACAATVLTSEGHRGRHYTLTGPQSLTHGDVAAVFSRELSRPVKHVDLPGPAFEAELTKLGLAPWFAQLLTDVYVTVFATNRAARVTNDVRELTGRAPRELSTFVHEHRAAFQ